MSSQGERKILFNIEREPDGSFSISEQSQDSLELGYGEHVFVCVNMGNAGNVMSAVVYVALLVQSVSPADIAVDPLAEGFVLQPMSGADQAYGDVMYIAPQSQTCESIVLG
jgi:hypothetical protein